MEVTYRPDEVATGDSEDAVWMKPVGERYGFISDEELIAAIDKFTYDQGLTQILVASKTKK